MVGKSASATFLMEIEGRSLVDYSGRGESAGAFADDQIA